MKRKHICLATILLCLVSTIFFGGCKKDDATNEDVDTSPDSILYSGPIDTILTSISNWDQTGDPQPYDSTAFYYFDVDGDSVADFKMTHSHSKVKPSMSGQAVSTHSTIIYPASNAADKIAIKQDYGPWEPYPLEYLDKVDSNLQWWNNAYLFIYSVSPGIGVVASQSLDGEYIGLKLDKGGVIYYGWLHVEPNWRGTKIKGYAINMVNNKRIKAGQTQ